VTLSGGCGNPITTGNLVVKLSTGIEESIEVNWNLYPNPSHGQFTIQSEAGGTFELLDITGKVINTYLITQNSFTISETLPAGIYFIRERETNSVRKLMIQ
jgi:hypothetical protein